MKRMNILRSVGMTLLATVFISSLAFAQTGDTQSSRRNSRKGVQSKQYQDARSGRRAGKDMGLGFFLGDLNLSDEQKTQMQEKGREFQLASEETRLKLRFAQQDLRTAMRQEPVDQAKVDSLWAEIAGLRQTQAEAQTKQLLELKGILTQEQLAGLQERDKTQQELRTLKAEYREVLLAEGESDTAKLQDLQTKITEKELVLEKERVEKRAARQNDFAQNRTNRGKGRMPKAVN